MLSKDRANFVTASQCHRVMANAERELAGRLMTVPDFEGYDYIVQLDAKPKVGEMAKAGYKVIGSQINEAWKYLQANTPVFTEGMESVAREIAMDDFIIERDPNVQTPAMKHGNDQELEAVEALHELVGVKFSNTGDNQNFFTNGSLGATPDGVEYDGFDVKSLAEVKNPTDKTHMNYLVNIHDVETLWQTAPEYYWQCQCGMAVTGAECYHFMSYHKGFRDDYKTVYVKVLPDLEHMKLLMLRADKVLARAKEIVDVLADFAVLN